VLAYGRIYQGMLVQSQPLAYIDMYLILAIAASIMVVLAFVVKRNDLGGGHVVVE
jgi:hypothetical protein